MHKFFKDLLFLNHGFESYKLLDFIGSVSESFSLFAVDLYIIT